MIILAFNVFFKRAVSKPTIRDDGFQNPLDSVLVIVVYLITLDQAMALSHLIVLNSPIEDVGAYAFQRKLILLLSNVFLNEVAKFCVGVCY